MRSRADPRRGRVGAAVLVLALTGATFCVAADPPAALPSIEHARAVVAQMRADPAFGGRHSERSLRWKKSDEPKRTAVKEPWWLVGLARWLSTAGRGVMWLIGAILVALLAVFVWRWARVKGDALRHRGERLPSHVNDLDIRPESLPDDVGAAALALCRRGERRAALSLLYRGALSRLVHGHGVEIGAASTEGECVALAQAALPPEGGAYFGRLVRAWQTEVYAGRAVDTGELAALCGDFARHFPMPAALADSVPRPMAKAAS